MHGSMMLFLFAIPMVESFAVYLTPKILGTRDFAFPRLTAYGYWCYLFGGTILTVSLIAGVAPNGGWFMYTPLSSNVFTPGINSDVWLLGITFVEISALSLAMEIVVSILKMRAPGMSLDRMPIFAWYILVTAMMMIVAFPPLILGSILLEIERAFGLPFFDPTRGGDRCCGSTCSGCSATRTSTSSSCRWRRCCRPSFRSSPTGRWSATGRSSSRSSRSPS